MTMRRALDLLIALMVIVTFCGWMWYRNNEREQLRGLQQVRHSLETLRDKMLFHQALGQVPMTEAGFPAEISPEWFDELEWPRNVLLTGGRPWLDVAPSGDTSDHPRDPVACSVDQAEFWYSPNRGPFRARGPTQFFQQQTLRLYNEINWTNLTSLPVDGDDKPAGDWPTAVVTKASGSSEEAEVRAKPTSAVPDPRVPTYKAPPSERPNLLKAEKRRRANGAS